MSSTHTTARCETCGSDLWTYQGERYCPDCCRATLPPRQPASTTWYTASSPAGKFIEGDRDLARLIRILTTEIMDAGNEDVIVHDGTRVVAVVRGDDLTVVRLDRPQKGGA